MADDIVIVGEDGTEHVFPAGFDPKRAAAIVRAHAQPQRPAPPPQVRSRTGALYTPPTESGVGDMVRGAADALNPLTYIDALRRAIADPMGAAGDLVMAPVRIAGGLVTQPAYTLGNFAGGLLGGEVAQGLTAMPYARMGKAGVAAAKAGAEHLPIVGPPVKAAAKAATESWQRSAPHAPTEMSPRVAGTAPALNDVLTDALNAAREAPKPASVSLPGGNTYRADGAVPSAANARPAPVAASAEPSVAAPETPATRPSAAPRPPSPRDLAVAEKLKLTPDEFRAFRDLVNEGYPADRVLQTIQGRRAAATLAERLGTPSESEVANAVADRNETGRWKP